MLHRYACRLLLHLLHMAVRMRPGWTELSVYVDILDGKRDRFLANISWGLLGLKIQAVYDDSSQNSRH